MINNVKLFFAYPTMLNGETPSIFFYIYFFLIGKDNSLKRGARKATQGKQNYARYTNLNTHHQKAKKNKEAQKVT